VGQIPIEELMELGVQRVFGASDRLQPVTEVPSSVSIVTADEISRYGYRTLADVLNGVRGFYVTNDRNYSYVGARGFNRPGDYSTRVLLLVNGHRRERQRLRPGERRRGLRDRRRDVRARRSHPWPGIVALRHQRAVRRGERGHADGRLQSTARPSTRTPGRSARSWSEDRSAAGSATGSISRCRAPSRAAAA
jgi:hypothetical protein